MGTKILKSTKLPSLLVACSALLPACVPEDNCETIKDPSVIQRINETIRPEVEYYIEDLDYTHTLEIELSETQNYYYDCGMNYVAKFSPHSSDPKLVATGTTSIYTISKRGMEVISILEE